MSSVDQVEHEWSLRERRTTAQLESANLLRQLILEGTLKPGERLNEAQLAKRFEISRGPLREAFQRLAAEGLVHIVSHRGAYVSTFTAQDLSNLYEARSILETSLCRFAAERRSSADLIAIGELLEQTERKLAQEHYYPIEYDFHMRISAMAHNDVMSRQLGEILAQLRIARVYNAHLSERVGVAYEEHVAIFASIEAAQSDEAARLMSAHLLSSYGNAQSACSQVAEQDALMQQIKGGDRQDITDMSDDKNRKSGKAYG
jgi:DNA-binding GntR family transcriptional regulator